jgi:nucleotide-binding universal stress UspA family protein
MDGKRSRILVALDGSPASVTALPVALAVGGQLGADVEVLHVVTSGASAAVQHRRFGAGLPEGTVLRERCGDPAGTILAAAAEPDVALVVLTTHGGGTEAERDLGSVAAAVVAGATHPVLLVRPEAMAQQMGRVTPLRRLLVPLDGTPATAAILRPVTELAARLGASVDVLYVADPGQARPGEAGSLAGPRYVDQPQHEWPQWASEVVGRLMSYCATCPGSVPVRPYLATGDVGAEVVRFAEAHGEDAIALVRRSRLETGRAQILRRILLQSPCPIMLVGCALGDGRPG